MGRFAIRSLDLNLLAVFVILWDTRSVSRTGEQLSLTQPAVSHALKRLRDRLDDPLFVPSRSGIAPTPRAAELITPVREALRAITSAIEKRSDFEPATSSVEYRVATTDWVESWLVPILVDLVQREAPGAKLRSVPLPAAEALCGRLEAGDIDVAVSHEPLHGPGVQCSALTKINFVTMIRRENAPVQRKFPLEDYLRRPHVVLRMEHAGSARIDRELDAMGRERRIGAEVQTLYGMLATAARAGYICTVPSHMGGQFAKAFGLSVHEPPVGIRPPHPLFYAWHARYQGEAALTWLLSRLREAVLPACVERSQKQGGAPSMQCANSDGNVNPDAGQT